VRPLGWGPVLRLGAVLLGGCAVLLRWGTVLLRRRAVLLGGRTVRLLRLRTILLRGCPVLGRSAVLRSLPGRRAIGLGCPALLGALLRIRRRGSEATAVRRDRAAQRVHALLRNRRQVRTCLGRRTGSHTTRRG
jgi:hypothetical protein